MVPGSPAENGGRGELGSVLVNLIALLRSKVETSRVCVCGSNCVPWQSNARQGKGEAKQSKATWGAKHSSFMYGINIMLNGANSYDGELLFDMVI